MLLAVPASCLLPSMTDAITSISQPRAVNAAIQLFILTILLRAQNLSSFYCTFKDISLISPLLPCQGSQLHPDQHNEDDAVLAIILLSQQDTTNTRINRPVHEWITTVNLTSRAATLTSGNNTQLTNNCLPHDFSPRTNDSSLIRSKLTSIKPRLTAE